MRSTTKRKRATQLQNGSLKRNKDNRDPSPGVEKEDTKASDMKKTSKKPQNHDKQKKFAFMHKRKKLSIDIRSENSEEEEAYNNNVKEKERQVFIDDSNVNHIDEEGIQKSSDDSENEQTEESDDVETDGEMSNNNSSTTKNSLKNATVEQRQDDENNATAKRKRIGSIHLTKGGNKKRRIISFDSNIDPAKLQEQCMVRKYATDRVFRGVKFINSRKMMMDIMGKVSTYFQLEETHKKTWEMCFEKEVRYAINNKRNSVSQDIKKVLMVTCVSGKKNWTPSAKVTEKLSECDKVTISDEAFAEIVLINYWDRWVDGKKTKYTDSRNGSLEFQGWGNKGHEEYNKIYKRIQNQRKNKRLNDLVDRIFLIQAKKEYEDIISIIQRNVVASKEVIEEICVDDF